MLKRSLLVALGLFLIGVPSSSAEEKAGPDPRQQMLREVTALRTAQTLAEATRTVPPTADEIETGRKIHEDLIRRFPSEAEPHVVYGEYLHWLEHLEEAFQQWQMALQLDPKRDDVLAAEADVLLQTGQIVAAADALEKAAALAPGNASYPYALAHVYTLFRRDLMASRHATEDELITRGTDYFRQATELEPENLSYLQAYAEAFYTQPDPDWKLARAAWESLLARSDEKDFIHTHLVRINIQLRDKSAAQAHLAALTDPAFAGVKAKLQKQVDRL